MEVDLDKILGIQQITDDCIVRGDGSITIGFSLALPPFYLQDSGKVWQLNQAYTNLLNILPPYTTWHAQDYVYLKDFQVNPTEEIRNMVEKENIKFFEGRPTVNHQHFVFVTFPNRFHIKKYSGNIPVITKKDYIKNKPFDKIDKIIETALRNRDKIYNTLKAGGLKPKVLKTKKLLAILRDYLSLEYPKNEFEVNGQYAIPGMYRDKTNMIIGDQHMRVFTMNKEPDVIFNHTVPQTATESLNVGIGYEPRQLRTGQNFSWGVGFPANHIVNTVIQVMDTEDMVNHVKAAKKKPLNVFVMIGDEASQGVQDECDSYINELSNNDFRPALVSMNIILHDSDHNRLKEKEDLLISTFAGTTGSLIGENVENMAKFSVNVPGTADLNYDNFISTTTQAPLYLSKETNYLSDARGFTFVDLFGRPVTLDIFESPFIKNRNGIIVAPSGGGKSVLMNNVVSQIMMADGDVIITDIGHSYVRTNYFEGGRYFDSAKTEQFQFNPFVCPKDKAGKYLYRLIDQEKGEQGEDRINTIATLIMLIWKAVEKSTQNEWNIVVDSIINYYEFVNKNKKEVSLTGYEKYLTFYEKEVIKEGWRQFIDFESLKLGLYPYAKGSKQKLLNATANLDINNDRFVVFDLESLKKSDIRDFKIISMLISNLVIEKVMQSKKRVYFFNDEVQDFLEDQRMGRFIAYLFRTVRKKGGSIFIIGQNINFIKNAAKDVSESVLANCDIKMFLDHSNYKEAYKDLLAYGLLDENEIEKLENLVDGIAIGKRYKEFLLKLGNHSLILRNEFSPVVEMIYTTTKEDVMYVNEVYERTGNQALAIRKAAEKKYNYKK